MFKNKLKLTKKLARLVAVSAIPLGIVAASSHASAMNYPMLSKLLARKGSVPTAGTARRPVVQSKIGPQELKNLSCDQLIYNVRNGASVDVSLERICGFGKFKFAVFLFDNKFIDKNEVNKNVYDACNSTIMSDMLDRLRFSKSESDCSDVVVFIKYLVEKCGAQLDFMHNYDRPLAFSFADMALPSWIKTDDENVVRMKRKYIVEIFNYLVSKGMSVNVVNSEGKTPRFFVEDFVRSASSRRSPYEQLIHQLFMSRGAKLYI